MEIDRKTELTIHLEVGLLLGLCQKAVDHDLELELAHARLRLVCERSKALAATISYPLNELEKRLTTIRQAVETLSKKMAQVANEGAPPSIVFSELSLDEEPASQIVNSRNEEVKSLKEELHEAGSPVVDLADFSKLLAWCESSDTNCLLALEEIERAFLSLAATHLTSCSDVPAVSEQDEKNLECLVNKFQKLAKELAESESRKHFAGAVSFMEVELNSRVALISLIAYTVMYRAALEKHPMLKGFAPIFRPDDLGSLVLPNRDAQHGLKQVSLFLWRVGEGSPRPVFGGMETQDDTLSFARQLAKSLPKVAEESKKLFDKQNEQIDTHWENVKAKKLEIQKCCGELEDVSKRLDVALEEQRHSLRWCGTREHRNARNLVDSLCNQQGSLRSRLKRLKKPIKRELQLPYSIDDIKVAVALGPCLPQTLAIVCNLGATTRDSLCEFEDEWSQTVNNAEKVFPNHQNEATLWQRHDRVPLTSKKTDLESFECREDGVYALNERDLFLLAGNKATDLHKKRTARLFEQESYFSIPTKKPSFETKSRSNCAIAEPHVESNRGVPTKEAYQALFGVRADAVQQPRKILNLLRDQELPLGDKEWILTIKQALFQVGPFDVKDKLFEWRKDWLKDKEQSMSALQSVLKKDLITLYSKQKDRSRIILLAHVAAYFSQWSPGVREIGRQIGLKAKAIADDLDEQFMQQTQNRLGEKEAELHSLRAKEALCLGAAVLAHSFGEINDKDAETLAGAAARLVARLPLALRDKADGKDVKEMRDAVLALLARRARDLDGHAKAAAAAAAAAVGVLFTDEQPKVEADWARVDGIAYTWHCKDANVHVCLLTGVVLHNGAPPAQLPRTVVNSELFKRTFVDHRFEVAQDAKDGTFKALYLERDDVRYYFADRPRVTVEEKKNVVRGRHLALLDERVLACLPRRIAAACSAWRDQDCATQAVVLRGKRHWDDDIRYVALNDGILRRVPEHVKVKNWRDVENDLPRFDKLVAVEESPGLAAIAAFEREEFVHTYRVFKEDDDDAKEIIVHELVRYGLKFKERGGDEPKVDSLDWPGWSLDDRRAKCGATGLGTLWGLEQFLQLRNDENGLYKLIVPDGSVTMQGKKVNIEIPDKMFADDNMPWKDSEFLEFHEFNEHRRFKSLVATTRPGRLHLAALYTASESAVRVPDLLEKRAGSSVAAELLLHLDFTSELSENEERSLRDILRLAWFAPELFTRADRYLECFKTYGAITAAERGDSEEPHLQANLDTRTAAVAATLVKSSKNDERRSKHANPELLKSLMGEADQCVRDIEGRLASAVIQGPSLLESRCGPGEPQSPSNTITDIRQLVTGTSELGKDLANKLEGSHDVHLARKRPNLCHEYLNKLNWVSGKRDEVQRVREKIKEELDLTARFLGKTATPVQRIAAASAVFPEPGWRVLLRLSCGKICVSSDGQVPWPELNDNYREVVAAAARVWALLCVLEDRLESVEAHLQSDNKAKLLRELRCVREWDYNEHPEWLAFEVERGIRIWPEQFRTAHELMHGDKLTYSTANNKLAQLNVGMGKSSVILPMLLLYYSRRGKAGLPRLHLLRTMLRETSQTLAKSVGNCAVGCTLFTLPFSRLSMSSQKLISRINYFWGVMCAVPGAVLVTTPDWRLSLELAGDIDTTEAKAFLSHLSSKKYVNILDESDLLLHFRYELTYALGTPLPLPDFNVRVDAIQALLSLIDHPPQAVRALLQNKDLVVEPIQYDDELSSHARIVRLRRDAKPELRTQLHVALSEEIVEQGRRGIGILPNPSEVSPMCLNDPNKDLAPSIDPCVLVLRGLLAGGILVECLTARNLVDFGVPRGKHKRAGRNLAVPFRASDLPSLRADLVQPEVLQVFTHLAHYQDGLPDSDLRRAIAVLLELGPTAQSTEFSKWKKRLPQSCAIQSERTFDLDNPYQFAKEVVPHFKYNKAVIDFWLRTEILPSQTQQFPSQRSKSAWSLIDASSRTIGFAGTNDEAQLLPLSIRERPVEDEWVKATDAMMVDRILQHTLGDVKKHPGTPEKLMRLAVELKCDALIDAGGLFAGVEAQDLAQMVFDASKKSHSAMTVFDRDRDDWSVRSKDGLVILRAHSPIKEAATFAFFDQARCRGADLQLGADCCALLTVGPTITKAQLVQAAGRMRGLGEGQKLCMVASSDLFSSFTGIPSPKDVLKRSIDNTVKLQQAGLLRWRDHGLASARRESTKCRFEVAELYSSSAGAETRLSESPNQGPYAAEIDHKLKKFLPELGNGSRVDYFNECERELEQEAEKEAEEEREVPARSPRSETDIICDGQLKMDAWMRVDQAIQELLPKFANKFAWPTQMYCTRNFIQAITDDLDLTLYQRNVDMVLVLPDGKFVLVSGREAEALLTTTTVQEKFAIANWTSIRESKALSSERGPSKEDLMIRGTAPELLKDFLLCNPEAMGALAFFAAEGCVPDKSNIESLLAPCAQGIDKEIIFQWFQLRSKNAHFVDSDAEKFIQRCARQGKNCGNAIR